MTTRLVFSVDLDITEAEINELAEYVFKEKEHLRSTNGLSSKQAAFFDSILNEVHGNLKYFNSGANVIISKKHYNALCRDARMLDALRSNGVDNWTYYDDAMRKFELEEGEEIED